MTAKAYTRKVAGKLQCSPEVRKEMIRQLESDIASAVEQGQALDAILQEMGTPEEVAEEFNENLSEEKKSKARKRTKRNRIILIVAVVAVLLLAIAGFFYWMLPKTKPISESSIFSEQEVWTQSQQVLGLLDEDAYQELEQLMTDELKAALKDGGLAQAKEAACEDFGALEEYKNTYFVEMTQKGQHFAVAQIDASYENVRVIYTLTFDEDGKLCGIYMR